MKSFSVICKRSGYWQRGDTEREEIFLVGKSSHQACLLQKGLNHFSQAIYYWQSRVCVGVCACLCVLRKAMILKPLSELPYKIIEYYIKKITVRRRIHVSSVVKREDIQIF